MADAVFTWVDGNDPKWRLKWEMYCRELSSQYAEKHGASETRFSDAGELYFAILLLRKNAPWINQIFVITDNQTPAWLNDRVASRLNIQVLDHRNVVAGYEDLLPLFNSTSLEHFLFKIPGIADHVLYLNDDFFILRQTSESDFFTKRGVLPRGAWSSLSRPEKKFRKIVLRKHWGQFVGYRGFEDGAGKVRRRFIRGHAPYPFNVSWFEEMVERHNLIPFNARFKFRDTRQVHPMDVFYNEALMNGGGGVGPADWICIDGGKENPKAIESKLKKICRKSKIKFLCFNSLDQASFNSQKIFYQYLQTFLRKGSI